jgi:hypothetical protein
LCKLGKDDILARNQAVFSRRKMIKNYYTAKEAQQRLGVDENSFYYMIRTGKIKKVVPPGKKQGVYPKSQIDKLAREMLAFMTYDEDQGIQFMKVSTQDDIQEEYELASLMFGNAVHDIPTRKAWLEKNPDIDFILRDHGRLVGFINLLPAKHETITRFMEGEIRGWEISSDDVLPFTSGSRLECIIMGMATTPDVDITRRTYYGRRIIIGIMELFQELAQKDVIITKFYATSATPTGISVMRNAGFSEIKHIGKRIAFELDTMTSDAWIAREYRQMIRQADDD